MTNIEKILRSTAAIALAASLVSCSPQTTTERANQSDNRTNQINTAKVERPSYKLTEMKIDQVFRDHDGIRVFYTDDSQIVREAKIYNDLSQHCNHLLKRFCSYPEIEDKKLSLIMPTYSHNNRKAYEIVRDLNEGESELMRIAQFDDGHVYSEIHLTKKSNLAPGTETFGGKHKTHSNMGEIK